MKMTAKQIGAIAAHCEKAIMDNPIPYTPEDLAKMPDQEYDMEQWEKDLKALIDADPTLPNYEDHEHDLHHWTEYFVEYFSKQD